MASKAAVDFSKVLASGLSKQTSAELVSFRKRTDEAKRAVTQLKQLSTSVDFAHYKNVLKNQDVVADAEKLVNNFKPKTYDVAAQTKALHSFETTAVRNLGAAVQITNHCVMSIGMAHVQQAEEAAAKIQTELKDLKETLSNIENARPFDQLTATDVINARPEIAKTIEEMVKKGKWSLPGYEEKFGSRAIQDSLAYLLYSNQRVQIVRKSILCASFASRSRLPRPIEPPFDPSSASYMLLSTPYHARHRSVYRDH
ncbi:ATP synthase d subunit [Malassezia yamatoensis]|uniref:ATP synthase subunit d, mitochondrial n=1 Tax=Malassezia yamatoensis TaxID=253288 RepID=A0AAJ5YNZ4_9BASI|nr:ATP synthase d subunit [Malassezia yamatoensis]